MQSVEPICELSNLEKTNLTSYENLVDNSLHSDVKFRVCGLLSTLTDAFCVHIRNTSKEFLVVQ